MNELRRFVKEGLKGLIILILIFSPLLIFNLSTDPYGVFWNLYRHAKMEPNKRFLKVRYILNNPKKYDSFIFGSSRVNYLDPEKIHGARFYNMTYSLGLPRDHFQDLQLMIHKGVKIKNLLIGIDYMSLLDNPVSGENNLLRKPSPVSLNDKIDFYKSYLLFRPDLRFIKLALSNSDVDKSKFFSTGILQKFVTDSTIENNPNPHINSPAFSTPSSTYTSNPNIEESIKEILNLVEFAKLHKIKITFFINPTHHITYLNLNLDAYFYTLKVLTKITEFYDFSGLNSVAINNFNFNESSHYRAIIGEMMIAKIFNDTSISIPDDFGRYITQSNVDDQILFHKSLLSDYLKSTTESKNYQNPIDLSKLKKISEKPTFSIEKINGIEFRAGEKSILLSTPWVKIQGWVSDLKLKESPGKVFVQFGDRLFATENSGETKISKKSVNQSTYSTTGWNVMIPTSLLKKGKQFIKIVVLSSDKSKYAISDNITRVNVFHSSNFVINKKLKPLNQSAILNIDKINGTIIGSLTSVFVNTSFLNINGWAIDNQKNIPSGGVIVTLDSAQYQSQFVFDRPDVTSLFHLKNQEPAGWGISIPINGLDDGIHELTYKVLNHQKSGYYTSNVKTRINFIKVETADFLEGISQSKTKTKFAIDKINDSIINNAKVQLNIASGLIRITGWAIDFTAKKPASKVLVEIDGKLFKAFYGLDRPDVANHFNNNSYQSSGWIMMVPVSIIGKGRHRLNLKIVAWDKQTYYTTDQEIFFNTI